MDLPIIVLVSLLPSVLLLLCVAEILAYRKRAAIRAYTRDDAVESKALATPSDDVVESKAPATPSDDVVESRAPATSSWSWAEPI